MLILQIEVSSLIGNSFFIGNTKCGDIGNTRFNSGSEWKFPFPFTSTIPISNSQYFTNIFHIVIETLEKCCIYKLNSLTQQNHVTF